MSSITLQPVAYTPSAPLRSNEGFRNTVIEDVPQVSLRRAPPQKLQSRTIIASPMSDNFPTPRAKMSTIAEETSSTSSYSDYESDRSSIWSKRSSANSFDEMYDLSESETEEIPLKLSRSVKERIGSGMPQNRYPSIVIPSPGQWPTIEKFKSATTALSPPIQVNLSPSILSQLHQRNLDVPSTSSTPSLDGSLTSEELAISSCPSTPDLREPEGGQNAWEPPVQLDRSAIDLLHHINGNDESSIHETTIEIPEEAAQEMREIVESPPFTGRFRIETSSLAPPDTQEAEDQLSALSVPSPGGFFASLDSTVARKAWSGAEQEPNTSTATEFYGVPFRASENYSLPTSTATSFYNLPWQERPGNPVEHVVSVASSVASQAPITARKVMFSPTETIKEVDEIDETYDDALKQTATANIDRTQLWLSAQTEYMTSLCDDSDVPTGFEDVADVVPSTPVQASLPPADSTPEKSVHFAEPNTDLQIPSSGKEQRRISPIHDGTFWDAWRHTKRSQRARDVFQHRQARAEAEQVKRVNLPLRHAEQLNGRYETTTAERPSSQRPVSELLPIAAEDEKADMILQADRERQALEQVQSSSWHLAAQKEVNGGKLLTSPIVASFKARKDVAILDLAGQVHCSWAWSVAYEHPDAAVYTTVSTDAEAHVASLEGPKNHHVVASPKPWELPFESNFFDVVSARNLHAHLRTVWPKHLAADEWDLTLRECLRVLKPGGYLEFDLLDAEMVNPEAKAQALGVEFAFNLKTRAYDPCSGKSFLPRLKRAGFSEIKRAWMVLPAADVVPRWSDNAKGTRGTTTEKYINTDGTVVEFEPPVTGSTKDVRAMTGLVGARMWEQWMLKLNAEMGRSEKRVLDEVAKAMEEGSNGNAGWRCLVGWAKKDF